MLSTNSQLGKVNDVTTLHYVKSSAVTCCLLTEWSHFLFNACLVIFFLTLILCWYWLRVDLIHFLSAFRDSSLFPLLFHAVVIKCIITVSYFMVLWCKEISVKTLVPREDPNAGLTPLLTATCTQAPHRQIYSSLVSARYSEGSLFRKSAIPKLWHPYAYMPARRALDSAVAELLVILVSFNGSSENIVLVLIILKLVGYMRYWLLKNTTKLLVRPTYSSHLIFYSLKAVVKRNCVQSS